MQGSDYTEPKTINGQLFALLNVHSVAMFSCVVEWIRFE